MKIELLTMPDCGHCAAAKVTIEKVRADFPEMEVDIIDVTENPEAAQKYMLMSAPGVVIDGKLEFTGGVTLDKLRKKLSELS
ncbi:MAG: hypothetical protein BMS9Abin24_105 [Thermodesulfobacteriota bacterium]|nr:MAG: hypothetical protein BMS9Abin24_105 [Thermodesulfobacteriota bacterium]